MIGRTDSTPSIHDQTWFQFQMVGGACIAAGVLAPFANPPFGFGFASSQNAPCGSYLPLGLCAERLLFTCMTNERVEPGDPQQGAVPAPPAPTPAAPNQAAAAAPVTVGKTNLSYGQFLGRTITASLVAPIGFGILLLVLFAVIAGFGAALAAGGGEPVEADPLAITDHVDGVSGSDDVVLVVDVSGTILSEGAGAGPFGGVVAGGDIIKDQLEAAATDPEVDAVILRLNTGGGSVVGSALISDGVAAVQAAGKPVVAHVTEISASGGMWAMAPADQIIASNGSIIGSIGVRFGPFTEFTDVVALDNGVLAGGVETTGGIDQFFITAGTSKDAGNPFREFTPEEQDVFQNIVDDFYDDFVDHVATNRELDPQTIIDDFGANVFSARDSVENGLIDEIGTFDRAHEVAAELAGLTGDYDVRVIGGDFGFLGALLGADSEPSPADVSSVCSATPAATVFFGDLTAWCGLNLNAG